MSAYIASTISKTLLSVRENAWTSRSSRPRSCPIGFRRSVSGRRSTTRLAWFVFMVPPSVAAEPAAVGAKGTGADAHWGSPWWADGFDAEALARGLGVVRRGDRDDCNGDCDQQCCDDLLHGVPPWTVLSQGKAVPHRVRLVHRTGPRTAPLRRVDGTPRRGASR